MSGEGKVVCVTGASGFIASWLVKLLLHRRYTVHATVRSLDDPKKTQHLLDLDGAKERLSVFKANLTVEGSFDSAVNGCICVFHTASPVIFSTDDPKAELIEPAVKGTLNVLKSAAKAQSVKRLVLTSSMAAVMFGSRLPESGAVVDETWFSDPLFCEQKGFFSQSFDTQYTFQIGYKMLQVNQRFHNFQIWYALSKTLAEEAAVKFAKENGLELVVINPGYAIGPFFQPTINNTSEGILGLIKNGKEVSPSGVYNLVDVRDVATAHILAFENPEAEGRYCVVGKINRYLEIMKMVDKLYPSLGHSERFKDGKCVEPLPFSVSRAKAESLGVHFTPLEVSIKDTAENLKEKKLLSF